MQVCSSYLFWYPFSWKIASFILCKIGMKHVITGMHFTQCLKLWPNFFQDTHTYRPKDCPKMSKSGKFLCLPLIVSNSMQFFPFSLFSSPPFFFYFLKSSFGFTGSRMTVSEKERPVIYIILVYLQFFVWWK